MSSECDDLIRFMGHIGEFTQTGNFSTFNDSIGEY